jgi:hypothetical protein
MGNISPRLKRPKKGAEMSYKSIAKPKETGFFSTIRLSAILLSLFVLFACELPLFYDPIYAEIPAFDFATIRDIGDWIYKNIDYEDGSINEYVIQSPLETYRAGSGNCASMTILAMYFIRQNIGGWPSYVKGLYAATYKHAWVYYEGSGYEPQSRLLDITEDSDYVIDSLLDYTTVMREAEIH